MRSPPFGTIGPASEASATPVRGGGTRKPPARSPARTNKRAEDTGAGCRANAAADLARAGTPGGDYMRSRLEHSAAVWTERAVMLERLEKSFRLRMLAA